MDFHVISFSIFLDLSLIKHGFFFFFYVLSFLCEFLKEIFGLFGYCFREQFLKT